MKLKSILLLLCCLLGLVVNAQETDIASKLQQVYRMMDWDSDANTINTAETLLSDISEADIATQPDIVKYLFYYCNAGIMDLKEINSATKIDYLRKAIALREQSLGVHDAEYTDLLCGLATELEETDYESSVQLYERALVIGMYPFYANIDDKAAKQSFGIIMWSLARMYESKGYENQLVSLYQESFDLLSANYVAGDSSSYIGLYALATYYALKKKDYPNAINTINKVLAYIETNEGKNCLNYIDILYAKASFYFQAGDYNNAISSFKETIKLLSEENYEDKGDKLDTAYSNLYIALISAQLFEEAESLARDISDDYIQTNNYTGFLNILYTGVIKLEEINQLDKANHLCDQILSDVGRLPQNGQATIYAKKAGLCLKQRNVAEAINWQTQAIMQTNMYNDKETYLSRLSDLAYLYWMSGDVTQSMKLYTYLKKLIEEANLEMNNIYGQTISAMVGINDNNQTEVGRIWRECLTHIETKYNRTNTQCAAIMNGLGVHLLKTGQQDKAVSYFRESSKIYSDLNMLESMEYATTLHNLGRAYMLQKKYKHAKSYLEQAKALQIQLMGAPVERTEQYLTEITSLTTKSR